MKDWFVTWNRPEYKEWAKEIKGGYLLIILRKEPNKYLCVKAELGMGEKGLPNFKVIEEKYFSSVQKANKQIQDWKSGK